MKKFKELFKTELSPGRFIVCSRTFDAKVSFAQLIKVKDDKNDTLFLFLKNSFIFGNDTNFEEFREKLNEINLTEIDSSLELFQSGDNDIEVAK